MRHKRDQSIDRIKEAKRQSREEEIFLFGKPINYKRIVRSRKLYTRKKKHKNTEY